MRIVSWNLLRGEGAQPADVLALIATHAPDLLLMQEVTSAIDAIAEAAEGQYLRLPMPGRAHGLAVWSPRAFRHLATLDLPRGGRLDLPPVRRPALPPRIALLLGWEGLTIANVHLDHGQVANRRQLRHIAAAARLDAVIGDFNTIGPVRLAGFADIGPRCVTHWARGLLPFRLDRCLTRGIAARRRLALPRGPSDHRPILVELLPRGVVGDG